MIDFSKRLVYRVDGMEQASTRRGLVYKEEDTKLLMDIYAPAHLPSDARLPAVIFVHGGPIPADMTPPREWGFFQSYGELAAASGLIGVTFNHRLHGRFDYFKSQQDIAAAMGYVRAHADELCVDADRLAYWVFSGGGPQLSWVFRERPAYLRCVLAFYAMLDLRHATPADADAQTKEAIHALSVATYLKERSAGLPMYIARAGLDTPMLNIGVDIFIKEALEANAALDFSNHARGQHGFDFLDNDDRSREIIARALAFAQEQLGGGK